MEAGFIEFDPTSEFFILETLDYDEEVLRPESLRFFTLDEQLTDYFDKVLPKKAKITKFEYTKISKEVSRLKDLYNDTIVVTDDDYIVDFSRKEVNVSWVKPIYSDFTLTSFSFAENWNPLYTNNLRSTANYYTRMLSALPKPYKSTSEGVPFHKNATLVNEDGKEPIIVLSDYERTRGVIHDDGSFNIVKVPVSNTSDDVKIRGFYIEERKEEIPNPLADHPFLASNAPSKIITDEPLENVFPTIEAILNHAVPQTDLPYTEGNKYLKLYDVKMSSIPWNLWKDKFPPAPTISETPKILSVKFPKNDDITEPSKKLQDAYKIKWVNGIEPRQWLSKQEDCGNFVVKMLLSNVSSAGLLPPALMNEKPNVHLPLSTPEECLKSGSFDEFLNSGVYRSPPWEEINKAVDKHKPLPTGVCVPTSRIVDEISESIVAGKLPWKESTDDDILKEHQKILKLLQHVSQQELKVKYEKYAGLPISDVRKMIIAVINDKERLEEDKADAIEKLLRGKELKERVYFDKESFLICNHTLEIMKGEMEKDSEGFLLEWTTTEEGFRTCKYCSERINNNVFAVQDDFDENGNPIISHEILQTGTTFHGESHLVSFTSSLTQLKQVFNLNNAGESILYLLLSLLQILPLENQLIPILEHVRGSSKALEKSKLSDDKKQLIQGLLGIGAIVVLLQTHNPFLIPRRSFGSKIMKLSGYPRDTEDENDSPVVDTIISVLKTTFSEIPGTFKGAIAKLLRKVISKPKEVRKEAIGIIKNNFYAKFKAQFLSSKERYVSPIETEQRQQISMPLILVDKLDYKPNERIGLEEKMGECNIDIPRTYLSYSRPPNVSQEAVILSSTRQSNNSMNIIKPDIQIPSVELQTSEITKLIQIGFPKNIKLDKIQNFIKSVDDSVALLTLLNRILDILSIQKFSLEKITEYRQKSTYLEGKLMRDSARGLLYSLFQDISNDKNNVKLFQEIRESTQKDLTMKMILITKEEATQQESELRTREREVFKQRMRQLDDSQREVTKMMLDIGIAPYVITNEDREIFKREYGIQDPEEAYNHIINEQDMDRPEGGFVTRESEEGEPIIVNGHEIDTDRGDYGDMRQRAEGGDYNTVGFDDDEGYGV